MSMRLLRGLAGKLLTCGCLVGVYETYEGTVVKVIDARGAVCLRPDHRERAIVHDAPDIAMAPGVTPPAGAKYSSSPRV